MSTTTSITTRKRPVNLTLNEDLVLQAKGLTSNLSAVVESLLTEYVAQRHKDQLEKTRQAATLAMAWNAFNERSGSFADEHSIL